MWFDTIGQHPCGKNFPPVSICLMIIYIYIYTIIDRLNGNGRIRESFWQYKLETFAPRGLDIRLVDT